MAVQHGAAHPAPHVDDFTFKIAVDFGTTYSGVVICLSNCPERQFVLREWPRQDGTLETLTNDKVPTRLSPNKNDMSKMKCGSEVLEDEQRFQEFKLLLDKHRPRNAAKLAQQYPDGYSLRFADGMSPISLSIEFLAWIRRHVEVMLTKHFDTSVIQSTKAEFIVTVPAIWSDDAQGITKMCARKAGMGDNILIISEPEAAMVHAVQQLDKAKLKVNNVYVLCDLGGGTADLISYQIESLQPLKIKEVVGGDGDRCGGVFVNRKFLRYVQERFAHVKGWDEKATLKMLTHFENVVKRRFRAGDESVLFKLSKTIESSKLGIVAGRVVIPGADMEAMFEDVFKIIFRLIQEQVRGVKAKALQVEGVLLVGGFGSCQYLYDYLRKLLDDDIELVQIKDAWTAVAKGAMMKALESRTPQSIPVAITSRVARRSYGITRSVPFQEGKDPEEHRFFVPIANSWYVENIDWFLNKGTQVRENKDYRKKYEDSWPVGAQASKFVLFVYSFDGCYHEVPAHPHAEGVQKVAELKVDLGRIPAHRLRRKRPPGSRSIHFVCYPSIHITFFSAHVQYHLVHDERTYGSVETEYA